MRQKSSDEIIKQTSEVINENNLPLFVTDGRKYYKESLIKKYSETIQPQPIIKNGKLQKPILKPFKELKYAQVIKTKKDGKLKNVKKKIIFGKTEEIDNSKISTTLIERQNLNLRQDNKRLARKTISYSKKDEWLQKTLNLYKSTHNFIKPHHSLKKKNIKKIRNNVWKKYDKITLLMSIGLTDHIWFLKEFLTYPYHKI
jgi:hypothetical protein